MLYRAVFSHDECSTHGPDFVKTIFRRAFLFSSAFLEIRVIRASAADIKTRRGLARRICG
jgi:hypothetical protein